MSAQDEAYKLMTERNRKHTEISPCTKKTKTIHEMLKKIEEQMVVLNPKLDDLSALRQEIGSLHAKVDGLTSSLATLITLMERKVEHDALEDTVLLLMKKDLEK